MIVSQYTDIILLSTSTQYLPFDKAQGEFYMKFHRILMLVAVIFLLNNCASGRPGKAPQKPLKEIMREDFFRACSVNEETKKKIIQGTISNGMSRAEVRLSWGEPDFKSVLEEADMDIWSYDVRYQRPMRLVFRDDKLLEYSVTEKTSLVRFGNKNTYQKRPVTGFPSTVEQETDAIVVNNFSALMDRRRFTKNRLETIREYKDKLQAKGIGMELDENNDMVRLSLIDTVGENQSDTLDLNDVVLGVPEDTVNLEIGTQAFAGFLLGYQMNYSGKCRFKSDEGIKESRVILNWFHSPINKPDVYKTVACKEVAKKETGLFRAIDIRNSFKKEAGGKAYIVADYFDCERGHTYNMYCTFYGPDGKLYNTEEVSIKASSNHIQHLTTLNLDCFEPGNYMFTPRVYGFKTNTIEIEVTD